MTKTFLADDIVNVRCVVVTEQPGPMESVLVKPFSSTHGHALYVAAADVSLIHHGYKVGDTVHIEVYGLATVVHIHGDYAWVRFENLDYNDEVVRLINLSPVAKEDAA